LKGAFGAPSFFIGKLPRHEAHPRAVIPILTWHAMNVGGPGYGVNDHVAFREDLEWLHGRGMRVVPLARIVEALRNDNLAALAGCVGLSFDDGPDFDFHDVPHPAWGPQRGMARLLEDFRARHGAAAQPGLHATSFTVVSPAARAELDRTCMIGCRWWNDDWYAAAEARGLLAIESHGWDHNHASLRETATTARRGTFDIRDPAEAEVEVARAAAVLRRLRGRDGEVLFAYPYGPAADYLADSWFPANGDAKGIPAAFTAAEAKAVSRGVSRWRIPRYVFGDHWKSQGDLAALIRDAAPTRAATVSFTAAMAPPPAFAEWRDHLRTW
jgi:hypothetical protein